MFFAHCARNINTQYFFYKYFNSYWRLFTRTKRYFQIFVSFRYQVVTQLYAFYELYAGLLKKIRISYIMIPHYSYGSCLICEKELLNLKNMRKLCTTASSYGLQTKKKIIEYFFRLNHRHSITISYCTEIKVSFSEGLMGRYREDTSQGIHINFIT